MRFCSILFLSLFCCLYLHARNLTGTVCGEDNAPISGVNVSIRTAKDAKVVATTYTTDNGTFVLYDVEAGKYTLSCTYVGYSDYTAEVQVAKGSDLDLGTLVMYIESVQIGEVSVLADRNVFTAGKQYIYPSEQQVEKSSGGLDLLQKLPIPLLDVNPISRTVSSMDPTGGVALLINDIPADANDISILDPKQVKRIEVIRSPGMMNGANTALVHTLAIISLFLLLKSYAGSDRFSSFVTSSGRYTYVIYFVHVPLVGMLCMLDVWGWCPLWIRPLAIALLSFLVSYSVAWIADRIRWVPNAWVGI